MSRGARDVINGKLLVVAGGGTGGHVLAGVAIAEAWRRQGGSAYFVGARGGLEEKLVPRAGYPLQLLRLGSLKQVSWVRRARTVAQLPIAILASARFLLARRPVAVIGVGGYASGPLVLVARLLGWAWGARVAILEQNSVPGLTNRILGRFAHRVFSAFPGVETSFPGREVVVTGNPVRPEIRDFGPASRKPFGVFVFGGSQGAVGVNTLVIEALQYLADLRGRILLVHQTGEVDHERVREAHAKAGSGARVERFIHDMAAEYRNASLLVCRAGSGTLSEIAAAGRASVLIPFPHASDNHQEKNARLFEQAGAAKVLVQGRATGADLAALIRAFLGDPSTIPAMEAAARSLHRPDAAERIASALSR